MTALERREMARRVGTEAGEQSARARGLDDWDDTAEQAARAAEHRYLTEAGQPLDRGVKT